MLSTDDKAGCGHYVLKSTPHRLNTLYQLVVLKNLIIFFCELSWCDHPDELQVQESWGGRAGGEHHSAIYDHSQYARPAIFMSNLPTSTKSSKPTEKRDYIPLLGHTPDVGAPCNESTTHQGRWMQQETCAAQVCLCKSERMKMHTLLLFPQVLLPGGQIIKKILDVVCQIICNCMHPYRPRQKSNANCTSQCGGIITFSWSTETFVWQQFAVSLGSSAPCDEIEHTVEPLLSHNSPWMA